MRSNWAHRLLSGVTRDIGIDLGTANTLVYVAGKGIVLREPSVIAITRDDGRVLAVGAEARQMIGKTPAHIEVIRPLKDGVIADFDQTEQMLKAFLEKITNKFLLRKNVVVGVPSGVTEVERRAVIEATRNAGATHAYVIEEPLAAAFGAGLPVHEPSASIVVDIGGGTTEVAIISMSGIVHSHSIRIGGNELDEAIVAYMRRAYNLAIGEQSAEKAKLEIGSVLPLPQELITEVKGRDLVTGMPKSMKLSSDEVRMAFSEPIHAIIEAVKVTLEAAPPELAADSMDRGITLCGGGALLRGMDRLLSDHTSMKITISSDPLTAVAKGTGMLVEQMHYDPMVRKILEKASLL